MLSPVCVEELANLRQAEEARKRARLVLLAEVRRSAADAGRTAPGVRERTTAGATPTSAPVRLADWRRGLGHRLIATGERLVGSQSDHDPVPAA